jgi:site-specific recombinase XerD
MVLEFAARRRTTRKSLWAARDFVRFLERNSYAHLDESVLLQWFQEQLPRRTLSSIFAEFFYMKDFMYFLEERGVCPHGLFRQAGARSGLLALLEGPRLYDANTLQLEDYWRQTLADFEISLRGYSLLHQAYTLRIAGEFAGMLQSRGTSCPDEDVFLEWLDRALAWFSRISTVVLKVPCLERFCQFLVEKRGCPSNPVREWRRKQLKLCDALQRRRQGQPPQLRPPRFQSFLAGRIEAFIVHKRTLGRQYVGLYILELLDIHLRKNGVQGFAGLDEKFFSAFLSATLAQMKAATRGNAIILLRQFFRFLARCGDILQEHNPCRFLHRPMSPAYSPYIFTLKEIAAVLSWLRDKLSRPAFEREMLFAFFHLVYACGLRISEAIRLNVQDVNFEEKTLFIRESKFGKSRLIPVGKRAAEYMHNYHLLRLERLGMPEDSAPFFVRAIGLRTCRSSLGNYFRRACREIGIVPQSGPSPRIHDLRHAMAVHRLYKWYLEGADSQECLQLLSLYLGHRRVTDTEHYLHLAQDLLRIAGRPMERSVEKWFNERQVSF